jgi:hypothetical protein
MNKKEKFGVAVAMSMGVMYGVFITILLSYENHRITTARYTDAFHCNAAQELPPRSRQSISMTSTQ